MIITPTIASDEPEAGGTWPSITVNVLSFNRVGDLARTLTAITAELDYPLDRLEVVVVDNASTDGSAEMVELNYPEVTLERRERNAGISGWNDGFRIGQGEYFLVLDDDCYVSGGALKLAVAAAVEEDADLVSWRVLSPWWKDFAFNDHYDPGLLGFWGCSVLVSKRAVERLTGFDPDIFVWGHEVEFTARLLDAGFCHLFVPEVNSLHMKRSVSQVRDPRSYVLSVANLVYFSAKLLRPIDAITAVGNLVLRALLQSIRHPRRAAVLPALPGAALRGARNRRPVRPAVSRLYRSNLIDLANPLRTTRGLRDRIRGRRDRFEGFWRKRPALYPGERASLQIEARSGHPRQRSRRVATPIPR
jgi:GT2 family glycosyltransferase